MTADISRRIEMRRRVVVTGLGIVSPIGNDVPEVWNSVKAGKCGIGPITRYDASEMKVKLAAEVKDFHPEKYIDPRDQRHMDRYTVYAVYAAEQAFADSGLGALEESRDRWGTLVSSGIGGIGTIEEQHSRGLEKGFDRVSPYFIPMSIANMAAGNIAIRLGLRGMCSCTVTSCAAAANGIGEAFHRVRDGYEDVMFTGGAEATVTPLCIGGFTSMKALTRSEDPERASIPFDKERSGFVMGEGAGILVLEEYAHAVRRGAKIYAEISGFGAACDAYHITAPDPEGTGAARSMQLAMDDAGITPADIDYINAHGTSTRLNDAGETKAIRRVFGAEADRIPVSSTKSMTGHLLGASAAVESVITVLALKNGFIPPTIGYRVPDEECDLDVVPNRGREASLRYAASNSLGFGGHNVCLIYRSAE